MSAREALAEQDRKIKEAEAEYATALAEIQSDCEHKTLLEAPYEPSASGFFDPLLPIRICEDCGLEEVNWTFRTLVGRAYRVRRHEIYRARPRGEVKRVSK